MSTFLLIPVKKTSDYTFYCVYQSTNNVPMLFAPCVGEKEAKKIGMDYNSNMKYPPYGFKIHWENNQQRLTNALKRTLFLTRNYGPHNVFVLHGYNTSNTPVYIES